PLEVLRCGRTREQRLEARTDFGLRIPTCRPRAKALWCRRIEVRGGDPAAERAVLAHEQDGASHRSVNVRRPTTPAAPTRRGSGTFVRQSTSSAARKTSTVITSTITCVPMTAPAPTIAPAAAAVAPFVKPTTIGCFR